MRSLVLSLAILALAGCGLMDDKKEEVVAGPLPTVSSSIDVKTQWTDWIGNQGKPELFYQITPARDGDMLYAANVDGVLYAIDLRTGKKLWKASSDFNFYSAVGAGSGMVVLGTRNGMIAAFSQSDGKLLWTAPSTSDVLAAPQISDDTVVVQTVDAHIAGYDKIDGRRRWVYQGSAPSLTLRTSVPPILESRVIYAGLSTGMVVALDEASGAQIWGRQVAISDGKTEIDRLIDVQGLLLSGDTIYAASFQGKVAAIKRSKGAIEWSETVSTQNQIALGEEAVIVISSDGLVLAFNAASGRALWTNDELKFRHLGTPIIVGSYLAVLDGEGLLHVFNPNDGTYLGRENIGIARTPPVVVGEQFILLNDSGWLQAYSITAD